MTWVALIAGVPLTVDGAVARLLRWRYGGDPGALALTELMRRLDDVGFAEHTAGRARRQRAIWRGDVLTAGPC